MSTISKTLVAALVGILVGGAAYVMAAPADSNSPSKAVPSDTTSTTGTTTTADVSGPCDEAEHANDPRCAGPQRPEDNGNDDQAGNGQTTTTDDGPGHDVGDDNPGEHGNRGPGSQNSGPGSQNSGPGNSQSDDGPNHDVGDDHGGHGADDGPGHDAGDDHGGDSGSSGSGSSGSGSSGSGGSGSSHSGGSDDD
jgi:hypothetical protein